MSARAVPEHLTVPTIAGFLAGFPVTFHTVQQFDPKTFEVLKLTTACVHHPTGPVWVAANHPHFMQVMADIAQSTD